MRPTHCWFFASLIVCGAGADPGVPGAAEDASSDSLAEAPIAWNATYASWYSFQGLDYSQRRPVLQPQVSGSLRGFTLTAWGNMDQTRRELNEIDISLQQDWGLRAVSVGLGYARLQYPHRDWEPTQEVLAELTAEAPLHPSLSVHWDVAAGSGRYWALGVNHAIPWQQGSVALATHLYFQEHYYELTGIPALETSLCASTAWAGISVQPTLSRFWTWPNGDFRNDQAIRGGWALSLLCSSR